MQEDLLNILHKRLTDMKCAHGHNEPVKYVDACPSAERKFLCENCLRSNGVRERISGVQDLPSYFSYLQEQQTLKCKTDPDLLKETETALAVVEKLREDVNNCLGDIKTTVNRHYKEFIDKIVRSSHKGVAKVSSKIDHETRRSFDELSSIENSLKLYHEGGSTSIIKDVLDQSLNYASKRSSADNALYDLLCGLEVKNTVLQTHSRLTYFVKKYFPRKVAAIKGARDALYKRMEGEREACHSFFNERKRMLDGLKSLTIPQPISEVKEESTQKDQSMMGRRKLRELLNSAKKQFEEDVSPNNRKSALGKRKAEVGVYDPKTSFDKTFGGERHQSIDNQMNNLSVSGAMPKTNRLSELLSNKKLITQEMAHQSNKNNSTINDNNRSKKDPRDRSRTGRPRNNSRQGQPNTLLEYPKMAEEPMLNTIYTQPAFPQPLPTKSLKNLFTPGGYVPPENNKTRSITPLQSVRRQPLSLFKEKRNSSIGKSKESADLQLIKSLKENLMHMQQQEQLKKALGATKYSFGNSGSEKENVRDPRLKMREALPMAEEEKVEAFIQPSQLGLNMRSKQSNQQAVIN